MLQQTTFSAVLPRFLPFLDRFPDVSALSAASEDEVLAAWSGLGYYARARNLRSAAIEIVARHGGEIPREMRLLKRLPGFGDYMAAAVASLAFGRRVPAVESNVERVLSRVFALRGVPGSRALREKVTSRARRLLPSRRAGDGTVALMDLGQLICTPRRPICPTCPVTEDCEARRRGDPEAFPGRRSRPSPVSVSLAAAIARKEERLLLVRRRSNWLNGLWEFPSAEADSPEEARRALARRLRPLELALHSSRPIARARHTVVNRRIEVAVFLAEPVGSNGLRGREARWFLPVELANAAIPTLTRKIADAAARSG